MKNVSRLKLMMGLCALSLALLLQVAPAGAQTLCNQFDSTGTGGKFVFQNNFYNPNGGSQCITVNNASTGAFSISNSNSVATNGTPGGYPSVYMGCHWGNCSDPNQSNMPAQMSDLASASTSWSIGGITGGAWDAAYDIWFNQSASTSGQPNGTEVMIWFNYAGSVQPAGTNQGTVTIDGHPVEVWIQSAGPNVFNHTWNIVSYRAAAGSTFNSASLDLLPFFNDAINRGQLQESWWLIDVETGFEAWQGASGLTSNSFAVDLSKYSQGGGGGNVTLNSWQASQNSGDLTVWTGGVGGFQVGDWLLFNGVDITGMTQMNFNLASAISGTFNVVLDSYYGPSICTLNYTATGGWSTYNNQACTLNLNGNSGSHALYVIDTSGAANLGTLTLQGGGSSPLALVQAENYSSMSGVQTEPTTDVGGGLDVGYIDTGDWMSYDMTPINIPSTGTYTIAFRVASLNGGSQQLSFEEAGGNPQYNLVTIPSTGGWQNWITVTAQVTLSAGIHRFGIGAWGGGWNINWFSITQGAN